MQKILDGIVEFRKNDFEEHRSLFKKISREQNPHTLFIGCSDSRVVPSLITKTLPGELFIIRNIANIVPPWRESGEYLATTSAIEYAVIKLNVENIIICGHSNCGGCSALYLEKEELDKIPHTKKWLSLAFSAKEHVENILLDNDFAAREWLTEQANILEQMKHFLSWPFIAEKYKQGTLQLSGWHYIIETGEIFSYNKEKKFFEKIN